MESRIGTREWMNTLHFKIMCIGLNHTPGTQLPCDADQLIYAFDSLLSSLKENSNTFL